MFIELPPKNIRAFTLVEMLVSTGLFTLVGGVIMAIFLFSVRSFETLVNYSDLDKINRIALDKVTSEIRQAVEVTGYSTNSIAIITGDNHNVSYYFNNTSKKLLRNDLTTGTSQTLVSSCTLLDFDVYQRNNISNTFDQYPAANGGAAEEVKVVRLTWKASRTILGTQKVSEDIQTARVIIRKQH
jgi:Tfp pilus assembly protein PilW